MILWSRTHKKICWRRIAAVCTFIFNYFVRILKLFFIKKAFTRHKICNFVITLITVFVLRGLDRFVPHHHVSTFCFLFLKNDESREMFAVAQTFCPHFVVLRPKRANTNAQTLTLSDGDFCHVLQKIRDVCLTFQEFIRARVCACCSNRENGWIGGNEVRSLVSGGHWVGGGTVSRRGKMFMNANR